MQRREFIFTSIAVAGGIAIGGYYLVRPEDPLSEVLKEDEIAITPYVILDSNGVTIIAPRAEMGQGIHGTLATLVAEELEIPVTEVKVIHGPASVIYANKILFPVRDTKKKLLNRIGKRIGVDFDEVVTPQLTGAQTSIQDAFVKMRKAGAATREVLVKAAARKLGVEPKLLKAKNGHVVPPDGSAIPYTSLINEVKGIKPPVDPPLKPREKWTQLGHSQPRVDMVSKCTGTAQYSIDVRLPGMLYATVRFNPHIGAGVKHFDDSTAKEMPGFVKTVEWRDGIIVIATNTWYALEAAEMIDVEWESAPYPATSAEHRKALLNAIDNKKGKHLRNEGDVNTALTGSEIIEGTYYVPYLAHATMEPMNAVAWYKDGQLDIWAGNQNPTLAQELGAHITGIARKSVNVHTTYMGGGFGRRLERDFIMTAVYAAVAMKGTPVKVTWSRESDMTHDTYRPMAAARFLGSVSEGKPIAFALDISSPSLFSSYLRRSNERTDYNVTERLDQFSGAGAKEQPYKIRNYRVTAFTSQQLLPVGWLRGVGETQNVFFHETAIDELAYAAGTDPIKMRISQIDHAPSLAVLEAVKGMSKWDSDLPDGHARGVAYALASGAATAQVIEISNKNGAIHIEKVFAAIDVGIALDPVNIESQIQSSIIFGLSAAMNGEITVTNGKVDQTSFHNYPIMRINQAPEIQVSIHESGSKIFGVGESGTPTAPPALGNAIFAMTGQRIRELPFSKSIKFV